jgi:hypothetical protein
MRPSGQGLQRALQVLDGATKEVSFQPGYRSVQHSDGGRVASMILTHFLECDKETTPCLQRVLRARLSARCRV